MKDKLFKFKVSSLQYDALLNDELDAIKKIIGDYEIVKTRNCPMGFDMKVWCKKKDDTNKKVVDEIKKVFDNPAFPEDREEYIYEIMKRYGKLD